MIDVDRAGERVDAELAVAAVGQRPDVTGLEAVGRDHLVRGLAQLLDAVRQLHEVDLAGALEAPQVVHQAEDGRAAIGGVGANALEDAGAVVHRVAEDVHLGVCPGHELAVHPDLLGLVHADTLQGGRIAAHCTARTSGVARRSRLAQADEERRREHARERRRASPGADAGRSSSRAKAIIASPPARRARERHVGDVDARVAEQRADAADHAGDVVVAQQQQAAGELDLERRGRARARATARWSAPSTVPTTVRSSGSRTVTASRFV